jgi:hypothetical protein
MKKTLFLVLILGLFTSSALGQLTGNPENFCRNGSFPRDSEDCKVGMVKAKKGERVHFYDDSGKCPKSKNCRRKSYLVNDNEVLVSRTYGNFVCAWYEPKKGSEIVGWLRADKLEFQNYLLEKYDRWIGDWKYAGNSLKIKRIGKTDDFEVKGNAFWKGFGSNVHIGEIEANGTLNESIIKLKQDDCEIKLDLVVHYLVVSDNLKCGGANVTFSGVYLKY